MATLAAIRQGIAANLSSLNGTAGVQVSAYVLVDPNPPTVQILPAELTYDQAMSRGQDLYTLTIQALAPLAIDQEGQHQLDEMIDEPDSVKSLVEADKTLGGIVDNTRVTACSGYRVATLEGRGPVLVCEWTVEVWAHSI
jgi:hypothetical protein